MKRAKLPWPWPGGWAIYGNGLGSRVACFLAALKGLEMFNCGLILEHLGVFFVKICILPGTAKVRREMDGWNTSCLLGPGLFSGSMQVSGGGGYYFLLGGRRVLLPVWGTHQGKATVSDFPSEKSST